MEYGYYYLMKPANIEQGKSRVIVNHGVILNRISGLLATVPAWWRSRLPGHPGLVFSAAELDAIARSAASANRNQDIAGRRLAG